MVCLHTKFLFSNYTGVRSGNSEKNDKHNAAMASLHKSRNTDVSGSETIDGIGDTKLSKIVNAIGILEILCRRGDLPLPNYQLMEATGPIHARFFTIECRVSTYNERGAGRSKQAAKHEAARKMIAALSESKENMKKLLEQMEILSNTEADECYVNLKKSNESKEIQNVEVNEKHEVEIQDKKNENSASERVEAINIAKLIESQRNEDVNLKFPSDCVIFQPKYVAGRLKDLHNRLETTNKRNYEFVTEIFEEFQGMLSVLGVKPDQIILYTNDNKFMGVIHLSTNPRIIDVVIDENEINLKIILYRRVIETLLALINTS